MGNKADVRFIFPLFYKSLTISQEESKQPPQQRILLSFRNYPGSHSFTCLIPEKYVFQYAGTMTLLMLGIYPDPPPPPKKKNLTDLE